MTITYEAVQERPNYWDGMRLPPHRRLYDGRNADWRESHTRVAREHATLAQAERYARRLIGQRPGVPVKIYRIGFHKSSDRLVAIVCRDALGRTWTDLQTMEPLL